MYGESSKRLVYLIISMFGTVWVFSCMLSAKSVSAASYFGAVNTESTSDSRSDSMRISPEVIQSIHKLADAYGLWSQLGIHSKLFRRRVSYIKTERTDVGLFSIIRLTDDLNWDWQYIFLSKTSTGWIFAGNIDLLAQKNQPPEFQILDANNNEILFSLNLLKVSGTGWIEYEGRWYTVRTDKLKEVLKYPSSGANAQSGLQPVFVNFEGTVAYQSLARGLPARIEILYRISFASGYVDQFPESGNVFTAERSVSYWWDSTAGVYQVQSSPLVTELGNNFSQLGPDDVLRYYYPELRELAQERDELKLRWLRKLLGQCKDTPEKRSLLKLLG